MVIAFKITHFEFLKTHQTIGLNSILFMYIVI